MEMSGTVARLFRPAVAAASTPATASGALEVRLRPVSGRRMGGEVVPNVAEEEVTAGEPARPMTAVRRIEPEPQAMAREPRPEPRSEKASDRAGEVPEPPATGHVERASTGTSAPAHEPEPTVSGNKAIPVPAKTEPPRPATPEPALQEARRHPPSPDRRELPEPAELRPAPRRETTPPPVVREVLRHETTPAAEVERVIRMEAEPAPIPPDEKPKVPIPRTGAHVVEPKETPAPPEKQPAPPRVSLRVERIEKEVSGELSGLEERAEPGPATQPKEVLQQPLAVEMRSGAMAPPSHPIPAPRPAAAERPGPRKGGVTISIGRIEIVARRPQGRRRPTTRSRAHRIDPGPAFRRMR